MDIKYVIKTYLLTDVGSKAAVVPYKCIAAVQILCEWYTRTDTGM